MRRLVWLAMTLFLAAAPAGAAEPSPLAQRAQELVAVLKGGIPPEKFFSPAFLAQVPPGQVAALAGQLRSSYGDVKASGPVESAGPTSGVVEVSFEHATVRMRMAVDAAPPHLVAGLVVIGAQSAAADMPALFAEIVGLPGEVSLAAARLEEEGPADFLTQKADRPLAIGAAFKLFVLAELVRQVKAGQRRWSDVVPLGKPSLPSGILQDWPEGSPLTLHSLAALMISRSDNSAADTLIAVLGRDRIEALLPVLGVAAADLNRPFLSTREAFLLKIGDPALLARWKSADEAGRRAILPRLTQPLASLNPARFDGRPVETGSVEWFASPSDLVRTLDWLRRSGDRTALDLLAINPGLGSDLAQGFAYFGFKGGSEAGVLNMSFLLRNREGRWLAVSATWNNPTAALDEPKFAALVGRLVAMMK
jgi:hypothetical protein